MILETLNMPSILINTFITYIFSENAGKLNRAAEPLAHVQCIPLALIKRILLQQKAFQPIANLRFHNQLSSSLTDKKFADSLFGQYFIMK